MSSSEPDPTIDPPEPLVVLSHLVHRLLKREGGTVPVERVTLRVCDYADIGEQEAADLLDTGAADGTFTLNRRSGGSTTIVAVSPQGPEPPVITEAFGGPAGTSGGDDFEVLDVVTESIATVLRDAGYTTFTELADAEVAEIANLTSTLTESRAEAIIQAAPRHVPGGVWLSRAADAWYSRRLDETGRHGVARVLDITTANEPVGEPRYRTDGLSPDAVDTQYVSDIGRNAQDPVPTGLHILDNPDHPDVPKAATHPDAGDDALPVDEAGDVVPPAVPTEPRLQIPLDELLAKKLARGLVPVRIVGPRGSGKNYLIKYLCHRTNRGYVSVDCDEATHTEDLFGPLTPTEDGLIAPRNGPAKQALLNGSVLVLNEFPVMRAGAAMSLHRLLNEGKLLVKAHGELIEPHPSARIVITMNPPTREYRDSEPMNSATRGRFRALEQPYIEDVDEEVATLDAQVNASHEVVDRGTFRKIVQFAHQTRQNENWPTLSTRNLTILCEHIEDGASPKAAVKNEVWAVAEPNQYPEDAYETLNDYL
ncbi:AAA family ATPase [Haloarcula sp. Atlit-7R]|uniref:AAA family ATPase n=1 Tax=Haloarcula sp. Atlit-7R TaxID=2282125 RepID=UPI000EF14F00|nr:AAA family ATPase [Haloarcula sp. Atlit-7R]RLM91158.1 AAA family ATPase [Haloarcula sp. Atlit-7R]